MALELRVEKLDQNPWRRLGSHSKDLHSGDRPAVLPTVGTHLADVHVSISPCADNTVPSSR